MSSFFSFIFVAKTGFEPVSMPYESTVRNQLYHFAVCGIEPLSQLYARRYIQYPLPGEVDIGFEPM